MHQATGLRSAAPKLRSILGDRATDRCVTKERMTILVSPNYYRQRKDFYKGLDCTVKPLLLRWADLTANHIKSIMGIKDTDSQLYVSVMLNLLKQYQRDDSIPSFDVFFKKVKSLCKVNGQARPLELRIDLLANLIAESSINSSMKAEGGNLHTLCGPGNLVIVDLTDPSLPKADVNGIFQVYTVICRESTSSCESTVIEGSQGSMWRPVCRWSNYVSYAVGYRVLVPLIAFSISYLVYGYLQSRTTPSLPSSLPTSLLFCPLLLPRFLPSLPPPSLLTLSMSHSVSRCSSSSTAPCPASPGAAVFLLWTRHINTWMAQ